MPKTRLTYLLMITALCLQLQCKKPYTPAVFTKADNYLVVDGFINTGAGGNTSIILTRTKNLTDTVLSLPEHNAQVFIQSAAGASYPLQETGNDGVYNSGAIVLNSQLLYRVSITTSNGKLYQSDLVSPKAAPAIDSISWEQDSKGVSLYLDTHDPSGNTRFYRWQYVQTWEYHSQMETVWRVANGLAYVRSPAEQVHICYNSSYSTGILTGSSAALAQDVISRAPIHKLLQNDSTLNYRASFLVQQYALPARAYFYWQIIQKNSQQLGTLFDLQPSQLEGNIHCVSNPAEPVVGFMSAGTMQEKRIFIDNKDLQNWQPLPGSYNCQQVNIPQNPVNFAIINFADTSYAPWYFVSNGPVIMAKNDCLDCTRSGGTTVKPSFW